MPVALAEAEREKGVTILPSHRFEAWRGVATRRRWGLHRLPYRPDENIAKGVQVCFVARLDQKGFHSIRSVVLPAIEAAVNRCKSSGRRHLSLAASMGRNRPPGTKIEVSGASAR